MGLVSFLQQVIVSLSISGFLSSTLLSLTPFKCSSVPAHSPPAGAPPSHPPAPSQPTAQQPPLDCQSDQQQGPSASRRLGAWPDHTCCPLWHHSSVQRFFSDKMLLVCPAGAEICAATNSMVLRCRPSLLLVIVFTEPAYCV